MLVMLRHVVFQVRSEEVYNIYVCVLYTNTILKREEIYDVHDLSTSILYTYTNTILLHNQVVKKSG